MGSEREKNYDYKSSKKKCKRVNKRNTAVKGKHKAKKKLKTKVSSYEKAVQKFNESHQLNNSNTITNKRITTGRLKPQQSQVGMFLKGLRAPFVNRDSLTEARRNEDINKIIDIGGKSRRKEIFVKHKKHNQEDILKSLGLDEFESKNPARIQDIVSNTIHFKKTSSTCSCEDETMGLTERNRRVPKGRLPDRGLRRSALEEYCANASLTQLNSTKSSGSSNTSYTQSLFKGKSGKDSEYSFNSPILKMPFVNTNRTDMSFINCCNSQVENNRGKRMSLDLDETLELGFTPLSPLDKCTLSPITFPFQDQTEELINVKELAKEIPTAHLKSGRRKDDEKQTKPSESEEKMDSIKESEEFALKYDETVASSIHPALAPSGGTIQNTIKSLKQLYISNLEKIKTKKQKSPPEFTQFNSEPLGFTPTNEFFTGKDIEKTKPTPFLNGFEFITRKSENLIEEDLYPDPILLSQEILPEMEFPDLIITQESKEPQINAKTAGSDFQSRKSHLQIVTPNRQFYRRNMF